MPRIFDTIEEGLRRLAAQIAARKVVVKLFLRHPLHAKLYLLFRQDARLCRVSETVESSEPQVICSLGLRSVQE